MQIQKTNSPNFTGMVKLKTGLHIKWSNIIDILEAENKTNISYFKPNKEDSGLRIAYEEVKGSRAKDIANAEGTGVIVDLTT